MPQAADAAIAAATELTVDTDGDGQTDCADSDCQVFPFCEPIEPDCHNTLDDDVDEETDCDDSDASVHPGADETCNDLDDDCDGVVDDNGGAHYQQATGPTLGIPASDVSFGQVFESDGVTSAVGMPWSQPTRACFWVCGLPTACLLQLRVLMRNEW